MKKFPHKFLLAAAAALCCMPLLFPMLPEAALSALQKLGTNTALSSALLGTSAPAADAAVVSCESSAASLTPSPLQTLILKTAAPQAGLFKAEPPTNEKSFPELKNTTSYTIDSSRLMTEPLCYTLKTGTPQVLIIHTHGSEAYSQSGGSYEETDTARTTDKSKNVVRVGTVLSDELSALGLTVLHDTELYDYPSYSGSYARSLEAVEEYLRKYPTVKVVIDLHRDSATTKDGKPYRTEYIAPDGRVSSQLMLIAATGEAGLSFPHWEENMKLALRLQTAMDTLYPGLARPILVSNQRYNQHASPGYLLVEIGTDGNTLAEAETGARLFAECMAEVLGEIVE